MVEGRRKTFSKRGLPNGKRIALREKMLHALSILNNFEETGDGPDEVFHALGYLEWLLCREGKLQKGDRTPRNHRFDCLYDRSQLTGLPDYLWGIAKEISGTGHKAEEEIGDHLRKGAELIENALASEPKVPADKMREMRDILLHCLRVLSAYDETGRGFDEAYDALNLMERLLCRKGLLGQSCMTPKNVQADGHYDRYELYSVPPGIKRLVEMFGSTKNEEEVAIVKLLVEAEKCLSRTVPENFDAELGRLAEKDD